jgi:hypothetical protein
MPSESNLPTINYVADQITMEWYNGCMFLLKHVNGLRVAMDGKFRIATSHWLPHVESCRTFK